MDRLLSQLSETVPTDSGAAIVHGDYRVDNTIIDLSRAVPSLVAVLDWELSTLGDPLADLAMTLTYWHDRGDLERGKIPVQQVSLHTRDFPPAASWQRNTRS